MRSRTVFLEIMTLYRSVLVQPLDHIEVHRAVDSDIQLTCDIQRITYGYTIMRPRINFPKIDAHL